MRATRTHRTAQSGAPPATLGALAVLVEALRAERQPAASANGQVALRGAAPVAPVFKHALFDYLLLATAENWQEISSVPDALARTLRHCARTGGKRDLG
eukprot:1176902-Alexandrium_andersonii.AAC.1